MSNDYLHIAPWTPLSVRQHDLYRPGRTDKVLGGLSPRRSSSSWNR